MQSLIDGNRFDAWSLQFNNQTNTAHILNLCEGLGLTAAAVGDTNGGEIGADVTIFHGYIKLHTRAVFAVLCLAEVDIDIVDGRSHQNGSIALGSTAVEVERLAEA